MARKSYGKRVVYLDCTTPGTMGEYPTLLVPCWPQQMQSSRRGDDGSLGFLRKCEESGLRPNVSKEDQPRLIGAENFSDQHEAQ